MNTTSGSLERSLRAVNDCIAGELSCITRDVFDFEKHPLNFMGKAARARFTLLAAGALGAPADKAEKAAAAAELTHTASLLHDDCLDTAGFRRGLPTLYAQAGTNSAILVGNLLITLALDCAGRAAPDLPESLVQALRRMTEGALMEEASKGRRIGADTAQKIVALKTGSLFRWCGLAACRLSANPGLMADCARLGEEAGCAFQIIDDVLDFEGDTETCGKETLKDVKEGKYTLPLILALEDPAAGPEAERLLAGIQAGPAADLAPALALAELVKKGGFAAAARAAAKDRIAALAPLLAKFPRTGDAAELHNYLAALCGRTA